MAKTIKICFRLMLMFVVLCLLFFGYLKFTPSGNRLRLMLGGSILTSQHVQYAHIFLTPKEYKKLYSIVLNPPTVNAAPIVQTAFKPQSDTLNIKVHTVKTSTYTAKVLIINDPTTIHLVPSESKTSGQTLMTLVKEYHAIAGINAGGFYDPGGDSNGGQLIGLAISNGKLLGPVSKKKKIGFCGFTKNGTFIVGRYTLNQIKKKHIVQAVSFGPQLIQNHKSTVTKTITEAYGWAPRTAIGQDDNGNVIMVITDGRFYFNKDRGASMQDLVNIFKTFHARDAYALDGGGSTTMIYKDKLLMQPATNTRTGMRYLPDAFVVIPHRSKY